MDKDKETKDSKTSKTTESDEVKQARKEAHERIPEKGKAASSDNPNQAVQQAAVDKRNEEIDRQHELVDSAPVITPAQNPPPGYPRVEVMQPQPDNYPRGARR